MRIARLYITSLIEPVYIWLLTAVWVVPVVGAALTQKVCCGDQQPIIGLALVVAVAVATAALLPASYFQIHGFERSGGLYRRSACAGCAPWRPSERARRPSRADLVTRIGPGRWRARRR